MKETGERPVDIEVGNAWEGRSVKFPETNWIVGEFLTIPRDSLRHMQRSEGTQGGARATNIGIKWFVHQPSDDPEWGENKGKSIGRTLSILASSGEFEISFGHYRVTLDSPGDFVVWGPELYHSWRPLKTSTVVSFRWTPE